MIRSKIIDAIRVYFEGNKVMLTLALMLMLMLLMMMKVKNLRTKRTLQRKYLSLGGTLRFVRLSMLSIEHFGDRVFQCEPRLNTDDKFEPLSCM
jgi:hypothetical protein